MHMRATSAGLHLHVLRRASGDGCSIETDTLPLRSVDNWFPKLYAKCNCPAYDKKTVQRHVLARPAGKVQAKHTEEKRNLSESGQNKTSGVRVKKYLERFVQRLKH
ncbi:hypothetical protein ISCGN_017484 [Ixodes scapularis]